LRNLRIFKA